jgi:hypothetical protein
MSWAPLVYLERSWSAVDNVVMSWSRLVRVLVLGLTMTMRGCHVHALGCTWCNLFCLVPGGVGMIVMVCVGVTCMLLGSSGAISLSWSPVGSA